jgi:hypothetical protein
MNNYLAKPVKAATLKEMLEQYLHQPAADMPNIQQDAQEIAKFAMKDLRRIPPHKPKTRIDTQKAAAHISSEFSTTDVKQISPKTAMSPRPFNNVENGLSTSRKLPRRSSSENEPGVISQGWRYGSSNRSQNNQREVSDGTTPDKKILPSK